MVIDKEGRRGLGKEQGERERGEAKRRGKISERLSEVGSDVMSSRCLGFHVSHVCF